MEGPTGLVDGDEALKPVLDLALEVASANSNVSTIRTVVLKALSDPKVFAGFDEIKNVVQPACASSGTEGEAILRTLDLFSYGTYSDYRNAPTAGLYLALADSHVFKLRQLTILTVVQQYCTGNKTPSAITNKTGRGGCLVPYGILARELGFLDDISQGGSGAAAAMMSDSVLRQVEELALSCVYARIVAGQLCQKSKALFVTSRNGPPCSPRDVALSQGSVMLETLKQFHQSRLQEACRAQEQRQQAVQMQLDSVRHYHKVAAERAKKAESSSVGPSSNPALICGGGSIRGWPEGQGDLGGSARGSTSRRQTKRSRGGVGGNLDSFSRF